MRKIFRTFFGFGFALAIQTVAASANWATVLIDEALLGRGLTFDKIQRDGFPPAEWDTIVERAVTEMSPSDGILFIDALDWIWFCETLRFRIEREKQRKAFTPAESAKWGRTTLHALTFIQKTPRRIFDAAIDLKNEEADIFYLYKERFTENRFANTQHAKPPVTGNANTSAKSNFRRLYLPFEVSLEVPTNWWIISGDINTTIETAGEALGRLAGTEIPTGKRVNLFRANSMPRTTYAGIAVNTNDSDIPPDEIGRASKSDLKEMERGLLEETRKVFAVQKLELLESFGLERSFVSGIPTITLRYRRSGPQGPVTVIMTRLFLDQKEISLNLSYRDSEAGLWKPITDYMRKSLIVGKKP